MNIPIEEVIESLKRVVKLDPKALIAIESDLEKKAEEIKADKASEKGPRQKTQLTVVLLDPEGHVKGDVTAFVFKQSAENDAGQTLDKVYQATYAFNRRPKAKGTPISNVGNVGDVKPRFLKEQGLQRLNKEACRVLVTQGPIPTS